ncbi:MAG: DUF6259 domain-containing protein [Planctomycetota bacterium]|nr:DUF6259 domain-containing protein [Planctomycetota bacterium]
MLRAILLFLSAGFGDLTFGAEWDDFGWRADCRDAAAWTRQPGWLGNGSPTAVVKIDDGALCFRVDEPSRGMKWSLATPAIALDETPWLVVRYRAENVDTHGTDYFVYVNDHRPTRQLSPLRLSDVVADGRWHVAAIDLSTLTEAESVDGIAVQVQAGAAGKASVWFGEIGLWPTAPEGAEVIEREQPVPTPPDWIAPLNEAQWIAQRGWLANPAPEHGQGVERPKDMTLFRVHAAGQGMKWSWNLPAPVTLAGHRYVSLRYRAVDTGSQSDYALCVFGKSSKPGDLGYATAVGAEELLADGRWHTVDVDVRRLAAKYATITGLAIQVQAAKPDATFELADLRLVQQRQPAPLADAVQWTAGAEFRNHTAVPIDAIAGSPAAAWRRHLHLTDWFQEPAITVEGIPFVRREQEPELAATALRDKAELRLAASGRASEVYLLLLAAFLGPEEPVYGSGRLRAIRDVDRFRLRLEYADGTADECLPMNVATRQFGITSGPQVVVAVADAAKNLVAVVVKDQCRQAAFAVVAVTLRTDGQCAVPETREEGPTVFTGIASDCAELSRMDFQSVPDGSTNRPTLTSQARGSGVKRVGLEAQIPAEGPPILQQLIHQPSGWKLLPAPCPLIDLRVDGRPVPAEQLEPIRKPADAAGASRNSATSHPADKKPKTLSTATNFTWYRIRGIEGLLLGLDVQRSADASLTVRAEVKNEGPQEHTVALVAPRIGPYRLGDKADQAYYLVPRRGSILDHRDGSFRERYSGLFPVQFLDTFNPAEGRGLLLRTEDTTCQAKTYVLDKQDGAFTMGVEYPERTLRPGASLSTAPAVVTVTDGNWHRGLEAYRQWVRGWYQPAAPRQPWFREVFNFRQRFLWSLDPLYNSTTGVLQLQQAVDEARREFGGIDFLHLFDWGNVMGIGRIYGRTGDLSAYDSLRGGRDALRAAIAGIQSQHIPVGLYIEGYLLEQRGQLGQQSGAAWQLVGRDGRKLFWPDSTEMFICPAVDAWREVQASTYTTKVQELAVDGMYIDEFGFADSSKDCWSREHGHDVPSYPALAERDGTRMIRERVAGVQPKVAIYTEETPVDVTTQYQDGSFTYAMSSAQQAHARVPLNIARFALPDFKTIEILYCDKPTGSWATGVRWVFFNGEAIWLEGKADEWFEPQTREEIRRCYTILRKHRDAFTSLTPEPLVPTQLAGVFANRFSTAGKIVYTLYNSRHRTVRGPVLRLPHRAGVSYYDEWHGGPAHALLESGDDVISAELGPHGAGCVVQTVGQAFQPDVRP